MTLPVTKVTLMTFLVLMNYLCFIKYPIESGADNNLTISVMLMTLPVTKVMLITCNLMLMIYLCFIKCPTELGTDKDICYADDFSGNVK